MRGASAASIFRMNNFRALTTSAALTIALLLSSPIAFAHGGGLDASGCHTNRKTGEYHCHRSAAASRPATDMVKKSSSGICHAPSSPWYAQTIHFTEFSSLQECLDSGGRLPKG